MGRGITAGRVGNIASRAKRMCALARAKRSASEACEVRSAGKYLVDKERAGRTRGTEQSRETRASRERSGEPKKCSVTPLEVV